MRAKFAGVGHFVPERVVTNQDLEDLMDTTDAWIVERTGIHERRFVREGQGTSEMGEQAARAAMKMAGLTPTDLDFIIFATLSPDYMFPGCGVLLQDRLGCGTIGALDVRTQCTGFIYGLAVADAFIRTGMYKRILLVGAETQSMGLDLSTRGRDMGVIFGDGAGAAVLVPGEDDGPGVLDTVLHSEGQHRKELWMEVPTCLMPTTRTPRAGGAGAPLPADERPGGLPARHAALRRGGGRGAAADRPDARGRSTCSCPHQANKRISDAVGERLGLPSSKIVQNVPSTATRRRPPSRSR